MSKAHLIFKPIGKVQSDFKENEIGRHTIKRVMTVASLIIDRRFNVALDGIESYSHLIVIYHMHRIKGTKGLKVHPQGRKEITKLGLFATRSPYRPNPIGVTVVKLLERSSNILNVKGLDALDGSPIIDIKPYTYADLKRKIWTPEWLFPRKTIDQ